MGDNNSKVNGKILLANIFCICFFIVLAFISNLACYAQISFMRWDLVPVKITGVWLDNPWAGGLNNPQFSEVDMNGDGYKDLFVFDRSTNKIITFLNNGTTNQVDYIHKPEYALKFPKLNHWALLVDYNCDGKEDIFTSVQQGLKVGIAVYRNDYDSIGGLKFTLVNSMLSVGAGNLYVSEWDIPAINDIDGDGDIDILTFDIGGYQMWYFKNLSFDNYGNCDSLKYVLETLCWGNFQEAFGDCSVTLGVSCKTSKTTAPKLHAGSTSLAFDMDGDNDKDLIIGDITCNNAYMLTNGGDNINANMTAINTTYPSAYPVNLYRFPAAYYLDVNNDGLKDLLASPNGINVSENFTGCWYYKNIGSSTIPSFDFQTNSFLQNEMIETGEGAFPAFFDYNADGLLDIIIGNYGYFSSSGNYPSGLSLYKNIGTTANPTFDLITRDYAAIYSLGLAGIYPAFGDLDNDGDIDMIVGEREGYLHYFENMAPSGTTANFVLKEINYKGIDVGQFSTPQIVDVDRDGKLDLLVGEKTGTLNYFQNIGTLSNPVFNSIPTNDFFGNIDVMIPCCSGYSSPFLTRLDSTGDYALLVGTENGYIRHYTNIDGNLSGAFTLVDSMFENIWEGERSAVSGGDVDKGGSIDLLIGNYGGGIALYKNLGDSLIFPPPPSSFSIKFFPNPTNNTFTIEISGVTGNDITEITIHNVIGQQVFFKQISQKDNLWDINIDVSNYSEGIYFCKVDIITQEGLSANNLKSKFIVVR